MRLRRGRLPPSEARSGCRQVRFHTRSPAMGPARALTDGLGRSARSRPGFAGERYPEPGNSPKSSTETGVRRGRCRFDVGRRPADAAPTAASTELPISKVGVPTHPARDGRRIRRGAVFRRPSRPDGQSRPSVPTPYRMGPGGEFGTTEPASRDIRAGPTPNPAPSGPRGHVCRSRGRQPFDGPEPSAATANKSINKNRGRWRRRREEP